MLGKELFTLKRGGSLFQLLAIGVLFAFAVACSPTTDSGSEQPTSEPDIVEPSTGEETDEPDETDEPETAVPVTKTFFIGAEQVDCVGFVPQRCYLVKESVEDDYSYFYDSIEGFEWVAGFEYEILVEVSEIENPPADGSSVAYRLVEVVSQTAVPQPEINNIRWTLVHSIVGGDAIVPAPDWTDIYFKIDENGVSGNSGCNQFNGSVTIEGATISFGPLASTRMACGEDTMSTETAVLTSLQEAATYSVQKNQLTFRNSDGLPTLVFTAAEEITLFIGPEQVECEGVAPQYCLLVKENLEDEYTYFYDFIRFFDWQPGFEYELRVAVNEIAEPLADASSLQYTLIEIVNQTLVEATVEGADAILNTVWQWIRFDSPSEEHNFEVGTPEKYTLQFLADGTYQITNDCNVGNGRYTADGSSIAFEPAMTTLAFCGEDSLDMQFSQDLQHVVTYVLSDGSLYLNLKYDSGNIVMTPMP